MMARETHGGHDHGRRKTKKSYGQPPLEHRTPPGIDFAHPRAIHSGPSSGCIPARGTNTALEAVPPPLTHSGPDARLRFRRTRVPT